MRLLALLALGASAALLVDYMEPKPAFCGGSSGCAEIRESGAGTFSIFGLSISLPIVGVVGFVTLLLLSLTRSSRVLVRGLRPLVYLFGMGAVGLIAWQTALGAFCVLCMIVDVCAVLMAFCALQLERNGWQQALAEEESEATIAETGELAAGGQSIQRVWRDDSQIYEPPNPLVRPRPQVPIRLARSSWYSLLGLFLVAPLLYAKLVVESEVPGSIRELYQDDRATFVEFFDFQCSHCRDLSPRLKQLAQNQGAGFVFGYRPLDHHPQARAAARMAICAGEQGAKMESELAARFFQQRDFSEPALLATARQVVGDGKKLDDCLASERPDARIARDVQRLDEAGFVGLPTTFVGDLTIVGAEATMVYEEALRTVRAGDDRKGMHPLSYWGVMLVLLLVIVWSGWGAPLRKSRD